LAKQFSPYVKRESPLQLVASYLIKFYIVSHHTWRYSYHQRQRSFLLDSDLVCHAIGDNCIANKSWTLRVCLTWLIIIAGDNCVANKCCIYGLFLLFVILDQSKRVHQITPSLGETVFTLCKTGITPPTSSIIFNQILYC
jgi:hypothetical protein